MFVYPAFLLDALLHSLIVQKFVIVIILYWVHVECCSCPFHISKLEGGAISVQRARNKEACARASYCRSVMIM